MPYETTIDMDGTRVYTRYYGNLTPTEMFESVGERFSDTEALRKFKVIIADFSEVDAIIKEDASMVNFAELYLDASKQNPDVVLVGIMPTDQQFGFGRMWEAHAHGIPWPHRVVRSMEEAREWLREQHIPDDLIK